MTESDEWDLDAVARSLLASQDEPEDLPVPSVEYWADILERRAPLSEQDRAILAISPRSRARQALAQHRYRNAYLTRAANCNNIPVMQAAASSTGRRRSRFAPMKDFSVMVEPSGPNGWLIICDVLEGFPGGSSVELVDSEGTVWLSGTPNDDGRIAARHESVANPLDARGPFLIRIDGIELT